MRCKGGRVRQWGVAASLLVGRAYAQPERVPDDGSGAYAYTSPVECPQRSEFASRVNARQSVRTTSEVDGALNELLARVVIEPSRTAGLLYFRDARLAPRKVNATTCDEVVTGLALIAGVSLDGPASAPDVTAPGSGLLDSGADSGASGSAVGGASRNAVPTPTAARGIEGSSEVTTPPERSASTTGVGASKAPTATSNIVEAPSADAERRAVSRPAAAARNTRRLDPVAVRREEDGRGAPGEDEGDGGSSQDSAIAVGFGAAGGLWTALGRPEPRLDAFFELGDRHDVWTARIAGFTAWGDASALTWSADWAAYGARLEGCPIGVGQRWRLTACALGEVGALTVHSSSSVGSDVDDAQLLWADAGVGLRVASPAAWKINVEAQLDAVVPFTRYNLTFEAPAASLAHVPTVAVVLRLGFRLRPGVE